MFKKIFKFFDKLEDKTRARLSKYPVVYALIGAFGLALFWRGIFKIADEFTWLNGTVSIAVSLIVLLMTGLFVSFFIGDRIILSGLKHEKKLEEKTKEEVEKEINIDTEIKNKVDKIEHDVEEIMAVLKEEHKNADNDENKSLNNPLH